MYFILHMTRNSCYELEMNLLKEKCAWEIKKTGDSSEVALAAVVVSGFFVQIEWFLIINSFVQRIRLISTWQISTALIFAMQVVDPYNNKKNFTYQRSTHSKIDFRSLLFHRHKTFYSGFNRFHFNFFSVENARRLWVFKYRVFRILHFGCEKIDKLNEV